MNWWITLSINYQALIQFLIQYLLYRCVGGTEFSIDGTNYQYEDLGCDDWPLETIVENGSCGNDGSATLIEIGNGHFKTILYTR